MGNSLANWRRPLALFVALCILPGQSLWAAEAAARPAIAAEVRPVCDVELAPGGMLVGRLLDANGQPVDGSRVALLVDGKPIATTETDASGVFAVAGLRGGVHQIESPDAVRVCRLWTNGTAPPHAPSAIEMVAGSDVVRGQWGPPPGNQWLKKARTWAANPWVIGGVVAAAVAIPIVLSDDDGPRS